MAWVRCALWREGRWCEIGGGSGGAGFGKVARVGRAYRWYCGGPGTWAMACGWVWAVMGQLCGVGGLVVWVAKRVNSEGNCVLCVVGGALV
jgi:hypothetical protein